jgi:glycosyltransferase involved in cell wall biosynthesis
MTVPVAIDARAAIRPEVGGVERVARELVDRLPALDPGRYRVIAPSPRLAHRAGHAWEQLALPALARDADVILCPANASPLAGRRNAVFVHDLAPLVEPRWYGRAYGRWHRLLLRTAARRARLAIVPSETVRDELAHRLTMAPERIAVAPLGVDPAEFHDAIDAGPLRQRLALDRPYVLAVGTAIARKNLGLLDRAVPALADAGLDVVVAGGDRDYMRGDAAPAGARRLGHVAERDLPALYAGAAAFALPSLYEGFGLPCIEAMACGTPVVTTDRGALAETCGGAALYVDPADPDALARACLLAAHDSATRERLVTAGRERAATFTWERTAAAVDAAIGSALG